MLIITGSIDKSIKIWTYQENEFLCIDVVRYKCGLSRIEYFGEDTLVIEGTEIDNISFWRFPSFIEPILSIESVAFKEWKRVSSKHILVNKAKGELSGLELIELSLEDNIQDHLYHPFTQLLNGNIIICDSNDPISLNKNLIFNHLSMLNDRKHYERFFNVIKLQKVYTDPLTELSKAMNFTRSVSLNRSFSFYNQIISLYHLIIKSKAQEKILKTQLSDPNHSFSLLEMTQKEAKTTHNQLEDRNSDYLSMNNFRDDEMFFLMKNDPLLGNLTDQGMLTEFLERLIDRELSEGGLLTGYFVYYVLRDHFSFTKRALYWESAIIEKLHSLKFFVQAAQIKKSTKFISFTNQTAGNATISLLPNSVEDSIHCIICRKRVDGLILFCSICGHGGHMGEIIEWFGEGNRNNYCPAGCSHRCFNFQN